MGEFVALIRPLILSVCAFTFWLTARKGREEDREGEEQTEPNGINRKGKKRESGDEVIITPVSHMFTAVLLVYRAECIARIHLQR